MARTIKTLPARWETRAFKKHKALSMVTYVDGRCLDSRMRSVRFRRPISFLQSVCITEPPQTWDPPAENLLMMLRYIHVLETNPQNA